MMPSYIASVSLSLLLVGCGQLVGQSTNIPSPEISQPDISQNERATSGKAGTKTGPENTAVTDESLRGEQSSSTSSPSVINVRLLDDALELSESQVSKRRINLSVSNEATRPLSIQIIQTDIAPENIVIKEGKVDSNQPGVAIASQTKKKPIKPGTQETIEETLKPGRYKIIVTAVDQDKPVAYTELLIVSVV